MSRVKMRPRFPVKKLIFQDLTLGTPQRRGNGLFTSSSIMTFPDKLEIRRLTVLNLLLQYPP